MLCIYYSTGREEKKKKTKGPASFIDPESVMDAFQSFSFVMTFFVLLLSSVTLMRSNSNSAELFLIRRRIEELEIQFSKEQAIPDFSRNPGKQ